MNTITRPEAAKMIADYTGSQFFNVTFVKRTDGSVRNMTCRKGVKKFTNGGSLGYSPKAKNLVSVWDAQVEDAAKAYRMINLDSILEVKMAGVTYKVA